MSERDPVEDVRLLEYVERPGYGNNRGSHDHTGGPLNLNPSTLCENLHKVEVLSLRRPGRPLEPRYGNERAKWLDKRDWRPQAEVASMQPLASNPAPQQFRTRNLALAAFLIAGKHLPYVGTRVEQGRATFVFADPDGNGPRLEGDFLSGAECSATLFHSTVKRLRREIDNAAGGGR